jgi:hypothetical protein
MSTFTTFFNTLSTALAANPTGLGALTGMVTSLQGQLSVSGPAITQASALMPNLQVAVGLKSTAMIQSICLQIMGVANMPSDIKGAAQLVAMQAADQNVGVYFQALQTTVANAVAAQNHLTNIFAGTTG